MPVHPRGKARMTEIGLFDHDNMHAVEPLGYLEFLGLVRRSALFVTDSGGLQEETIVLGVPCLTTRAHTERTDTITTGKTQMAHRQAPARHEEKNTAIGGHPKRQRPAAVAGKAAH